MKTVRFDLPDDEAEALERAAIACGYASTADLARAAIEEFLATPPLHAPEEFDRDIEEHLAEKARGERGLTADEARALLRDAAEARR
jgi:hypothetical protein